MINLGQTGGGYNALNDYASKLRSDPNLEVNNIVNSGLSNETINARAFDRLFETTAPSEQVALNRLMTGSNTSQSDIWELINIFSNAPPTGSVVPMGSGMGTTVANPFMDPMTMTQPANSMMMSPQGSGMTSPYLPTSFAQTTPPTGQMGGMGNPMNSFSNTPDPTGITPVASTRNEIQVLFATLTQDEKVATLQAIGGTAPVDSVQPTVTAGTNTPNKYDDIFNSKNMSYDALIKQEQALKNYPNLTDEEKEQMNAALKRAPLTTQIKAESILKQSSPYLNAGDFVSGLMNGKDMTAGFGGGGFEGGGQRANLAMLSKSDPEFAKSLGDHLTNTKKTSTELVGMLDTPEAKARSVAIQQLAAAGVLDGETLKGITQEIAKKAKKGDLKAIPAEDTSRVTTRL